jgi:hypothetical protein
MSFLVGSVARSLVSITLAQLLSIVCMASALASADCDKTCEFWTRTIQTTPSDTQILDAGATGNKQLIPALRSRMKHLPKRQHYLARSLRLAMARLGDAAYQQRFYCELFSAPNTSREMYGLMTTEIPYVGGWFAIHTMAQFDQLEPIWTQALGRAADPPFDNSPRRFALGTVSKIVPEFIANPNHVDYKRSPEILDADFARFQAWVHDHESDLKKLEPTGDGVSFSFEACKASKKKPSN